ncbi:RHS repeat-associated protein [Winogradskyella wandonensis]|uniref:RHS repeat-associated protein n=1 Tax=Winogradskyella wandonensis TaxID=1442586 RepID=A0A4R1KJT9_9FLAO|nr:RHS repeat-associated core domain-containing protein [Winogradskyella wandonensis]TCK65012.1 RHS repeat-associated protein [Winogradskyella wandonensis]
MPMPNRNIEGNYRYGYQGEYAEKEEVGSTNSFELRLWDSRIGRWMSPDPYGEFFSPYLGMGNNPISLTDPDGGQTNCNCKGGFFKRLFKGIGRFFKNNFGRYRPKRSPRIKSPTRGSGKKRLAKREPVEGITPVMTRAISMFNEVEIQASIKRSFEISGNEDTPTPITLGGITKPITPGMPATFSGANYFNGGASAVTTDGRRRPELTSKLNPLTSSQLRELTNLANFLIVNPNRRVNFCYPDTSRTNPLLKKELDMLFERSFDIITTILKNNGVNNPNKRILRSTKCQGFRITII